MKEIMVRDNRMMEVSNYSFVDGKILDLLQVNEELELRLKNPLSQEQDRLRRSLIPNLMKNLELNQRYGDTFRFFEFGRSISKEDRTSKDLARETTMLSRDGIFEEARFAPLLRSKGNSYGAPGKAVYCKF